MEGLTASVSYTGSVPRLRVTRHTASPTTRIGEEQDSLAQATLQFSNFKRPSTYPDSQTSEDEDVEVVGTSSRLLSASLPPPDSSTYSGDTTHRLRALLNRFDNSSRNPMPEPRVIMSSSTSEAESDFDSRPAQIARASIKDLFQNALRDPGDSTPRSSSAMSNVEFRERLKDNEPIPRQKGLSPTLPTPDDSDASLFADESVPPPQMSTPTLKSVHLPDLSISPVTNHAAFPPSPPSPVAVKRDPLARADADLARLQRAVAPNITLPVRRSPSPSPIDSPPVPILEVPLRQSSSNSPEELGALSPSIDSSDLLDAHSFHTEYPRTPSKSNEEARMSVPTIKTPRFPGAFGTPGLSSISPPEAGPVSHHNDAAEEGETTPKINPVEDLPPTHPQANGYTCATPAPPGAYQVTPTLTKRKGILKVRFNGNVQTPEDIAEDLIAGCVSTKNGRVNGASPQPSSSEDDVPPLSLSPSRRKALRLVDEYGRARRFTEDGEEIMLDTRRKTGNDAGSLMPNVPDDLTITPRKRAKMRQMDAMGNEMTGSTGSKSREEPNGVVPESRRKKAVLSRLAKSLEELQEDLAKEENALTASAPTSALGDDERMLDLATVSKAARVERNKLSRKLQLERHAEDEITDKIFVARNPSRDRNPWEISDRASWWHRKWRLIILIIILELTLLYMGYRVAMMHAKHIWLKTHFDPFFPALYLHQSRPSFLNRFGSIPRGWSTFAISGSVQQTGVRGFLVGVGKKFWKDVWNWRLEPWEAWGNPAAGPPVPRPWPS